MWELDFSEIDWMYVGSVSLTAAILSLLTSVAGLPELKEYEEEDEE